MKSKYGQSLRQSAIEAMMNIASGMIIAWSISQLGSIYEAQIQLYIWSGFTWQVSAGSNAIMTAVLTCVSMLRSYFWRRMFNKIHIQQLEATLERERRIHE